MSAACYSTAYHASHHTDMYRRDVDDTLKRLLTLERNAQRASMLQDSCGKLFASRVLAQISFPQQTTKKDEFAWLRRKHQAKGLKGSFQIK